VAKLRLLLELPDDALISSEDLADELEVTNRTITNYTREPNGLAYLYVGNKRHHFVGSAKRYLKSRERRPNPTRERSIESPA
jgi:transcriptional antiterminator